MGDLLRLLASITCATGSLTAAAVILRRPLTRREWPAITAAPLAHAGADQDWADTLEKWLRDGRGVVAR